MGGGEWDTTQLKTADGMTSHNKVKTDTLKNNGISHYWFLTGCFSDLKSKKCCQTNSWDVSFAAQGFKERPSGGCGSC